MIYCTSPGYGVEVAERSTQQQHSVAPSDSMQRRPTHLQHSILFRRVNLLGSDKQLEARAPHTIM